MITGRELLAWLQAHPNQLDDPVHLLAQDDDAPSYLTAIEQDCFDENEGPVISLVSEHEKASEEPAGETNPDDEHADDCTGCNGPGIVPCAADEVIGRFAYRNGECIKDLEARFGEGLEVVERQADSEAQR